MKFNKGEWGEAYAFVKLLLDGKVYAADENLEKINGKFYPILKIFRDEIEKYYILNHEDKCIDIFNYNDVLVKSVPMGEFKDILDVTLSNIKNSKGATFEIPILRKFLSTLGIDKIKNDYTKKEDIKIEIPSNDSFSKTLTFSIKTHFTGRSTILNPSGATNFKYEIKNITKEEVNELNNINTRNKLKDRFKEIYENYDVEFCEFPRENEIFFSNLRLIDSNLPKLLAHILFYRYSHKNSNDISFLTAKLIEDNPLNLNIEEKDNFYRKKILDFVKASVFGFVPNEEWHGINNISGGLLSVKNDGEILCHHIFYDNDALDSYLFNNTVFDTPSSPRWKF